MKHLDETELIDLLDGQLPATRAEHADECDACAAKIASLRSALADAEADGGNEPSPLFWDHLASRVSSAIRDEPAIATAPPWTAWMRDPATAWGTTASIAVLLMVTALWRATLQAPVPRAGRSPSPASTVSAPASPAPLVTALDDIEADGAWAVVRAAAAGLAWEDAHAAGISPHPGSADGVIPELNAAERAELARLLASEMKQSGAS